MGVRVVETASGVAGPYLAKLLGDLGASVAKAEPSGGDPSRRHGPFPTERPDPTPSARRCSSTSTGPSSWRPPPTSTGSSPGPTWWSTTGHRLGDHNEYVFRELLGLDDAECAALEAGGHLSFDYLDADGNPL